MSAGVASPSPVIVQVVERGAQGLSAFEVWRISQGDPTLTPQDFYNYLASLASGGGSGGPLQQRFSIVNVASYTAMHTLSGRPPAVLLNASGKQVFADLTYVDGSVTVTFPSPFTGSLYLG